MTFAQYSCKSLRCSMMLEIGGFSRVTGLCACTPDRTTSSQGSIWNRPQRQIFGPHSGASRSLLYAWSLPLSFSYFSCFLIFSILLSLPFSYCCCVLLTIRLILVRLTYCTCLLFFHHASLTTIANVTHSNMFIRKTRSCFIVTFCAFYA